jgi:ATP-dependent Clp protease ATP-binding subunit ClpX
LFFHKDSLKKVAEQAIANKTGARGLRRILETLLNDALFEFPGTEIRYAVVDSNLNVHGFTEDKVGQALKLAGKGS